MISDVSVIADSIIRDDDDYDIVLVSVGVIQSSPIDFMAFPMHLSSPRTFGVDARIIETRNDIPSSDQWRREMRINVLHQHI